MYMIAFNYSLCYFYFIVEVIVSVAPFINGEECDEGIATFRITESATNGSLTYTKQNTVIEVNKALTGFHLKNLMKKWLLGYKKGKFKIKSVAVSTREEVKGFTTLKGGKNIIFPEEELFKGDTNFFELLGGGNALLVEATGYKCK